MRVRMGKPTDSEMQSRVEKKKGIRKRVIAFVTLVLIIALSIGLFCFYQEYPDRIAALRAYGYLGAFIISIIFNATVILPAGSILILSALGATMPSAAVVGLVGGAGAAIGEITGYIAGYSGRGLVDRRGMYERVEGWVARWGSMTIFVLSLVPFIFDLAGIAAGVLRFPFWKFLLLCWLGRTILYVTFVVLAAMGLQIMLPWFF